MEYYMAAHSNCSIKSRSVLSGAAFAFAVSSILLASRGAEASTKNPAQRYPSPVNGVCGTSNGKSLVMEPTINLCSTGTASAVTGNGPWEWTCEGSRGGATASCSASVESENGVCGSANGTSVTSAPSSHLCITGNASAVTGSGPWNWTCSGIDGGTVANCSTLETVVFAPYIDMEYAADDNLAAVSQASGIKTFSLAFIQSAGTDKIAWAGTGTTSIAGDLLPNGSTALSVIQALKAAGGNVIISFGGAGGIDPAMASSSAATLQASYQSVINRYGVTSLDFDIEGTPETDAPSIALRNTALAALKAANPGLSISFTLPTTSSGLDAKGLNVVSTAVAAGVTPNIVNVMASDFNAQTNRGGAMGLDAIDAIQGTEASLHSLGIASKIGVTVMIGIDDNGTSETFTLADAQQMVNYIATDSKIGRLTMWETSRDNGTCAGATTASNFCSGISQSPYAFSNIFETVTGR
jgi:Glycosyl hydrolases family 18